MLELLPLHLVNRPVQRPHMTVIYTITIPTLGGGVVEFGGLPHERARSQPQTGLRLLLSHSDWVTPDSQCHAYYQTHQDSVLLLGVLDVASKGQTQSACIRKSG